MNKKSEIGDIISGRKLISRDNRGNGIWECLLCKKQVKMSMFAAKKHCCKCVSYNRRASGESYVNSEEKLNEIKEKYKNGVTKEILEEWFKQGE